METRWCCVLLTEKGQEFIKKRITDLIKIYKEAIGIDKHAACTLFRTCIATRILDNEADIRYIQEILDHVDIKTTQTYTKASIKKLKQVHASTQPAR
jgi:integrase/recombinase XerD